MTVRVRGARGTTAVTLAAMEKVCERLDLFRATLVAVDDNSHWAHGWILEHVNGDFTVITDGIASGYNGEGPRGLQTTLGMLSTSWPHYLMWNLGFVQLSQEQARGLYEGRVSPAGIRTFLGDALPLTLSIEANAPVAARFNPTPYSGSLVLKNADPNWPLRLREPRTLAEVFGDAMDVALEPAATAVRLAAVGLVTDRRPAEPEDPNAPPPGSHAPCLRPRD